MPLFSSTELQDFLGQTVTSSSAAMAERVAAGWLTEATGVDQWPDPPPAQVFAWAIELGAIAHENPTALASRSVDGITDAYSRDRYSQILAAARESSLSSPSASGTGPIGSFPPAVEWPDPPRTFRPWGY